MNLNFVVLLSLVFKTLSVHSLFDEFAELFTARIEHLTDILNVKLQIVQRNIEREKYSLKNFVQL
jgi:hypothetical protein